MYINVYNNLLFKTIYFKLFKKKYMYLVSIIIIKIFKLQADLYESLAIFVLYSQESYETKIAFIFKLFDFDCSNTIELPELILSI